MTDVEEWVDACIKDNKVMIFSKTYCPFCVKAIQAFKSLNPKHMKVEQIENNKNMAAIQDYLLAKTGQRTVPRVFVDSKLLGGGDETALALKNGTLKKRLEECGEL